jgi:hypothetical protein
MLEVEKIKDTILEVANKIVFTKEGHTYSVNNLFYTSVTNKIKKFHSEFDVENQAKKYALKHRLNVEDVKNLWAKIGKDSADLGTDVHDFGEQLFYQYLDEKGLIFKETSNVGYKIKMYEFWLWLSKQDRYIPILSETKVFSEKYQLIGTFDLLLFDTITNTLVVVDYKTNKDLYKNFIGQVLFHPFHYLLDNPFNIYQLQLSTYQIPLEDLGFIVSDRWVVHISPEEYKILHTMDFTKQLRLCYEK